MSSVSPGRAHWPLWCAVVLGVPGEPACKRPPPPQVVHPAAQRSKPEPGAPAPPVTPDPSEGGGTQTADGVTGSMGARSDDSNAWRVPPAKPGEPVQNQGLGYGTGGAGSNQPKR